MSIKHSIFTITASMVTFLVIGWASYSSQLNFVTADLGANLTTVSIDEGFKHQLDTAISVSFLGFSLGLAVLLGRRLSPSLNHIHIISVSIVVSLCAAIGWMFYLAKNTANLGEELGAHAQMVEISIPLSDIPLYQTGVVSGTCVLITAIILILSSRIWSHS